MHSNDFIPLGIVAFLLGVFLTIPALVNYSQFISEQAQIEQLRHDVRRVDVAESEDVIGQVTQANQNIADWQRWNRVPFAQLFIPNGWDHMKPIELPERTR